MRRNLLCHTIQHFLLPVEIYTFASKERDEESGLSYFGARYYSSDLSIWLSVDPMSDKYPSLSPYVYCANNPVKLVDPNGEEVVGTDNKAVSYSYDNQGNVVWSSNASEDTKRIGNAMLQTKMGKTQFNKLIQSKAKIELIISKETIVKEDNTVTFGSFKSERSFNETGNYELLSGTITIYEGSCSKFKDKIDGALGSMAFLASPEEFLASVAGHEAEHATSLQNLMLENGMEKESAPLSIQFEILQEYLYQKTGK